MGFWSKCVKKRHYLVHLGVDGKRITRKQIAWKVFIYLKMGTSGELLLTHNTLWVP